MQVEVRNRLIAGDAIVLEEPQTIKLKRCRHRRGDPMRVHHERGRFGFRQIKKRGRMPSRDDEHPGRGWFWTRVSNRPYCVDERERFATLLYNRASHVASINRALDWPTSNILTERARIAHRKLKHGRFLYSAVTVGAAPYRQIHALLQNRLSDSFHHL